MTTASQALEARPTVEEVMRLADAVADAGSQMLPAVEIARRLATLRAALESTAAELEALRKDADRYRRLLDWLNDHNLLRVEYCQIDKPDTLGDWWVLREPYLVGSHVAYGKTEDAAIDAALSTSTAPSGSSAPPPNSGEGGRSA